MDVLVSSQNGDNEFSEINNRNNTNSCNNLDVLSQLDQDHNEFGTYKKSYNSSYSQSNDSDSGFQSSNSSPNSAFFNFNSSNISPIRNTPSYTASCNNNFNTAYNNNYKDNTPNNYIEEESSLNEDKNSFLNINLNNATNTGMCALENNNNQEDLELDLFSELNQQNCFFNNNSYIDSFSLPMDNMADIIDIESPQTTNIKSSRLEYSCTSVVNSHCNQQPLQQMANRYQKQHKSFAGQITSTEQQSNGLAVARVAPMSVCNKNNENALQNSEVIVEDAKLNKNIVDDKKIAFDDDLKKQETPSSTPSTAQPTTSIDFLKYPPPKKPLTPYMRFSKLIWQKVKLSKPGMTVCEVGTAIGQMWREMSQSDKQSYNTDFAIDKARYDDELNAYLQKTGLQASDVIRQKTKNRPVKEKSTKNKSNSTYNANNANHDFVTHTISSIVNEIKNNNEKSTSLEADFNSTKTNLLNVLNTLNNTNCNIPTVNNNAININTNISNSNSNITNGTASNVVVTNNTNTFNTYISTINNNVSNNNCINNTSDYLRQQLFPNITWSNNPSDPFLSNFNNNEAFLTDTFNSINQPSFSEKNEKCLSFQNTLFYNSQAQNNEFSNDINKSNSNNMPFGDKNLGMPMDESLVGVSELRDTNTRIDKEEYNFFPNIKCEEAHSTTASNNFFVNNNMNACSTNINTSNSTDDSNNLVINNCVNNALKCVKNESMDSLSWNSENLRFNTDTNAGQLAIKNETTNKRNVDLIMAKKQLILLQQQKLLQLKLMSANNNNINGLDNSNVIKSNADFLNNNINNNVAFDRDLNNFNNLISINSLNNFSYLNNNNNNNNNYNTSNNNSNNNLFKVLMRSNSFPASNINTSNSIIDSNNNSKNANNNNNIDITNMDVSGSISNINDNNNLSNACNTNVVSNDVTMVDENANLMNKSFKLEPGEIVLPLLQQQQHSLVNKNFSNIVDAEKQLLRTALVEKVEEQERLIKELDQAYSLIQKLKQQNDLHHQRWNQLQLQQQLQQLQKNQNISTQKSQLFQNQTQLNQQKNLNQQQNQKLSTPQQSQPLLPQQNNTSLQKRAPSSKVFLDL